MSTNDPDDIQDADDAIRELDEAQLHLQELREKSNTSLNEHGKIDLAIHFINRVTRFLLNVR